MKYDVLKPFYKLSNKTNYNIGDVIELVKEDAQAMLNEGYLKESKSKEVTEKPIVEEVKEVVAFSVSTKATAEKIEELPKAKK